MAYAVLLLKKKLLMQQEVKSMSSPKVSCLNILVRFTKKALFSYFLLGGVGGGGVGALMAYAVLLQKKKNFLCSKKLKARIRQRLVVLDILGSFPLLSTEPLLFENLSFFQTGHWHGDQLTYIDTAFSYAFPALFLIFNIVYWPVR